MKAVLLDGDTLGLSDLSLTTLRSALPDLHIYPHTSAADTIARLHDADIALSNKVAITREVMQASPTLKLILVTATGINNVDLAAAREFGITVCNAQNYATESVAQHTMALMLMLATQAHRYRNDVMTGLWSSQPHFCLLHHPITTLQGLTLGLVGSGHSGRRVAELARAFGMTVLFAQLPHRPADDSKCEWTSLLQRSDVLSLHCPLSDETRQLINTDSLVRMKRGAFLINVARGGLIDEQALLHALRNGHLGGAALDVLSVEPPPNSHPLLANDIPNLLITPHTAWASRSARQALIDQVAENARAFLRQQTIRQVTDL